MMKSLSKAVILFCSAIILTSCSPFNNVKSIGKAHGFEMELVKGGDFWITTYQKITDNSAPYVFYIEGDGAAFIGKSRISLNPTPHRPTFFKLAAMDPRPNVVYVARPCQYTEPNLNPKCSNLYWTDRRMSEDTVDSLNEVINKINRNGKFSLIGYSGGGGIAVLIAARNSRARDIITIAGNLDHVAFTTHHNITPMLGSLNPINYAYMIKNIPQLHLSGGQDKIIPPFIADKFAAEGASPCVKQMIMPKSDHIHGWQKVWESVLATPLRCYE